LRCENCDGDQNKRFTHLSSSLFVCHPEGAQRPKDLLAGARRSVYLKSRALLAHAPAPLGERGRSARNARATPNKTLHASACRSFASLRMTVMTVSSPQ